MTDRFEKLNPDYANEHAQHSSQLSDDRFRNLNPSNYKESQYARDVQRPNMLRTPVGKIIYWIAGISIVLLLPFAVYFNVILPMQANKIPAEHGQP